MRGLVLVVVSVATFSSYIKKERIMLTQDNIRTSEDKHRRLLQLVYNAVNPSLLTALILFPFFNNSSSTFPILFDSAA